MNKNDNYLKLKELIVAEKVHILPHKKYKGIRQSYVYSRCGMSLKYFENAYEKGDVILLITNSGTEVRYPTPWTSAL